MSKTTKRKHVTKEILEDYYEPEGNEQIVKIIAPRGNNLHEVETADKSKFLVSMPTKFRRNVWIKRGDFVIIESIKEGNKVQGEIVNILYQKQIKHLKQQNLWPTAFDEENVLANDVTKLSLKDEKNENSTIDNGESSYQSSDDDDDNDLFVNPNHQQMTYYSSESSSDESEDESQNEEEQQSDKQKDDFYNNNNKIE